MYSYQQLLIINWDRNAICYCHHTSLFYKNTRYHVSRCRIRSGRLP